MITIEVNNHKSKVVASRKQLMLLRQDWCIKDKKAFWARLNGRSQWDGYVRYISEETGSFSTGLLDQGINLIEKRGWKYKVVDKRTPFKDLHEPKNLGELEMRDYQNASRRAALDNRLGGIRFQRGILAEATNAGKSLIAASIIDSFSSKRIALFLVNNKTLFDQTYPDFCKLLGKENVGRINSQYEEWKRVNICMVQTLGHRMKKNPRYKNYLAKVDIVFVDEADEVIGRKDCRQILGYCYNATVRLALSGTPLMNKDPLKNQEQQAFFGPIIHTTSNKDLVDKGVSAPPDIRILLGNKRHKIKGDYKEEERKGIHLNKARHRKVWEVVRKHINANRAPILILFKIHDHGYNILKAIPEDLAYLKVELVHHETARRVSILQEYNDGKIDVLIASMIIKRGINLPRTKVLVNAAGGDSQANVLQVFGRLLRSHKSKKKVYMYDFYDMGHYLQRHSKHRIKYYKAQKFPVKELYKPFLKKAEAQLKLKLS